MGVLERGGTVRTKVHEDTKKRTLHPEIRANVEVGANVNTDALKSYEGMAPVYIHEAVDHAVEYVWGTCHTNGLENYWSLLKRCIKGTNVSIEPLRYNQRKHPNGDVKKDGERFVDVVGGIAVKRLT